MSSEAFAATDETDVTKLHILCNFLTASKRRKSRNFLTSSVLTLISSLLSTYCPSLPRFPTPYARGSCGSSSSVRTARDGEAHTSELLSRSWQRQLSVVSASSLTSFTLLQTEDVLKRIDAHFLHLLLCILMPQASNQDTAGSCRLLAGSLAHEPSSSSSPVPPSSSDHNSEPQILTDWLLFRSPAPSDPIHRERASRDVTLHRSSIITQRGGYQG